MKLALPLIFIFAITVSMSTSAQGSFFSASNTIKSNQQAKQKAKPQLSVRSSKQAAQMAKSRFGGKVLKVQKQKSGYRVKLIKTDGHIVSVYIDAKTGRISGGQ